MPPGIEYATPYPIMLASNASKMGHRNEPLIYSGQMVVRTHSVAVSLISQKVAPADRRWLRSRSTKDRVTVFFGNVSTSFKPVPP